MDTRHDSVYRVTCHHTYSAETVGVVAGSLTLVGPVPGVYGIVESTVWFFMKDIYLWRI